MVVLLWPIILFDFRWHKQCTALFGKKILWTLWSLALSKMSCNNINNSRGHVFWLFYFLWLWIEPLNSISLQKFLHCIIKILIGGMGLGLLQNFMKVTFPTTKLRKQIFICEVERAYWLNDSSCHLENISSSVKSIIFTRKIYLV